MASRTRLVALLATAACLIGLASAAPASAAPAYTIWANWGDTLLPPGGNGEFTLHVRNVGSSKGSGPMTVSDKLPLGVTITGFDGSEIEGWDPASFCSGVGTRTATCAISSGLLPEAPGSAISFQSPSPNGYMQLIFIEVAVSPSAEGTGTNTATVSGGGVASPVSDVDPITFSSTPSEFGVIPGSFESDDFSGEFPNGAPLRKAGAHPFELRVNFDTNQRYGIDPIEGGPYTEPHGRVKTVKTTLPVGLIGNPESVPKCDPQAFAATGVEGNSTNCPANTQVGYLNVETSNGTRRHGWEQSTTTLLKRIALYNLEPPRGVPADFGFGAGGLVLGHIYPELDAAHGYAITANSPGISDLLGVRRVEVTFWGVPGDPAHDKLRYFPEDVHTGEAFGASFGSAAIRPLLTNPMDCGVDNGGSRISAESWNDPGHFTPSEETGNHMVVEGCDDQRVRFNPAVALQPTSRAGGGPTGLTLHLEVPQRDDAVADANELYEQNGDVQAIPIPPMKKAVVTLPQGMTLSTSAAQGLVGCTPAQIGLGTNSPVSCPDASQYGTLTLHTPILPPDEPMHGFIYIAQQNQNPFGTFLAMYFVIQDESRGLLVKIPGKIELDPVTGQIKTTFDELPQFPVSDLELSLKGGVRAGLVNPATCGSKQIKAEFFSWADPATPVTKTSAYDVTEKPDGSPCVHGLAERRFEPRMSAGTLNPSAGAYSPFVFRLTRTDEDQEFSQLGVKLPAGLSAKLAGITECPDAALLAAANALRTGAQEIASPSCPASSQIGTTDVGSGVGQVITYIPGKAYLAGPYKGAPLSMVVITPIVAGPYDLGVIALRSALYVNPSTAKVSVQSDPLPQIYQGIPVRIRDIRVKVDRPNTTINPTSCNPMAIDAHVTGTGGDVNSTADDTAANLSERFQAANCASLGFRPKISFKLSGGSKRAAFPALRAVLKARPGDANIGKAAVTLPHAEFLANAHIRTVCTRVAFAASACPPGSVYGHARAFSPLLDQPLEGPVYLRSNGGERLLPDLVASLHGQIDVVLEGHIDSVKGQIRNTFDPVPDAPVSKFVLTMQGGKKGLLENSRNLCAEPTFADATFTAQNGKLAQLHPKMATDCKKGKRK
jgi:hypothetical protein